ncbi:hypothetical protein ACLQ2R_35160 [Streptosporangium sp. DT93]|uniref:hypothetical protein n=1 Tax=Streptosporangium sp. DT93 TaxID=3393428 RepID=UPI003CEA8CC1
MNVTRRTWVSAGVVGLVLAGGISVTAAAAAGGVERALGTERVREPVSEPAPVAPHDPLPSGQPRPSQEPSPTTTSPPAEDYVISREINPDPEKIVGYWTEDRLEEAEPFPMPIVEGPLRVAE